MRLFCIEKHRLAMRLGSEVGSAAAVLRKQLIFLVVPPGSRAFFSTIQTDLSARLKLASPVKQLRLFPFEIKDIHNRQHFTEGERKYERPKTIN
jgi:hypothetical protein